jgi:small subunit ribosomal protein S16
VAVKLRLMRMGKKKQPTFRVVAADSRSPRNGRFIEILGFYDPRNEPSKIEIDNDKALHWLREGAQPTERVEKLLKISGAWTEFTGEAPPPTVTKAGVADAAPVVEDAVAEEAADAVADEVVAEEAADAVADEVVAEDAAEVVAEDAASADETDAAAAEPAAADAGEES